MINEINFTIDFGDEPASPEQEKIDQQIDTLVAKLRKDGSPVFPFTEELFRDKSFFTALPKEIKDDPDELELVFRNTGAFNELVRQAKKDEDISQATDLFGAEATIPETVHADGRVRKQEMGKLINVDACEQLGIKPDKVLFFRVTQPSEVPKPEYYWTTDYFETQKGLNREISEEKRESSVILVSDLQTIAGEKGLIQDSNDDNGLAVRQIGVEPFDQRLALAVISRQQDTATEQETV